MRSSQGSEWPIGTRWRRRAFAGPLSTSGAVPGGNPCEESEETKKPPATRRGTDITEVRSNCEETPHPSEETSPDTRDVGSGLPIGDRCVISGCVESRIDVVYCAEHRRMADDGSLWLRCLFCRRPVAPHDEVACPEDRRRLDATVMPWEVRAGAAS